MEGTDINFMALYVAIMYKNTFKPERKPPLSAEQALRLVEGRSILPKMRREDWDTVDREKDVLTYIRLYCLNNKRPPSMREIADHFNISMRQVYNFLKIFEENNLIKREKRTARGIRINA